MQYNSTLGADLNRWRKSTQREQLQPLESLQKINKNLWHLLLEHNINHRKMEKTIASCTMGDTFNINYLLGLLATCFSSVILLGFFNLEDGGDMLLRNIR
jgi:hypothetical protein